jgi:hypothetical protein
VSGFVNRSLTLFDSIWLRLRATVDTISETTEIDASAWSADDVEVIKRVAWFVA